MNASYGAAERQTGIQMPAWICTGSRCSTASYQTSPACTLTLRNREEFRYILERAGACAIASGGMPLFRDDESGVSDPGNRCKLHFRHALLLALIRKKDNPAQGNAQAASR